LGHKSIVVDSGGDDAKQVSQIEDLITKQIDALVLIISGNTDGNAQIRKAKEAGINVITVDRNTTNPPGDSFVASDSEVASYQMGMWVAEQTGGKGVVGVIQGQLGSTPEIARDTGFEDALAQFPDLNTVEKQASKMWSRDEGVSIAQDLLTRNPNITVLYGRCDALAQGAAQAAKAMGRDDLLIVGFDGDRAALEDLKKGNTLLAATMTQQTLTIGRTATRFAIDAIEGRYIPPEVLYGSTLTTQDNVEQFMGDGHP
jgi:ribose transport system substrate-binding protein